MAIRALAACSALAACLWAAPASAGFSIQQDAFLRGFNGFAQASGRPVRMTLKFANSSGTGLLGTSKVGKFVYDLDGCLVVTGLSKGANQVIDTVFAANSGCALPAKLDDLELLARYLASLSGQEPARQAAEDAAAQAFKAAERTHKRQSVTLGTLKLDVEDSDVIGWAIWAR